MGLVYKLAFASAMVMGSQLKLGSSSLVSFPSVPGFSSTDLKSFYGVTGAIASATEFFYSSAITLTTGSLALTAGLSSSLMGLILERESWPVAGVVMVFTSATILVSPAVGASS